MDREDLGNDVSKDPKRSQKQYDDSRTQNYIDNELNVNQSRYENADDSCDGCHRHDYDYNNDHNENDNDPKYYQSSNIGHVNNRRAQDSDKDCGGESIKITLHNDNDNDNESGNDRQTNKEAITIDNNNDIKDNEDDDEEADN